MGGRDQIIEDHAELASSFLSDSELSGDSLPPTLVINLQRRELLDPILYVSTGHFFF